MIDWDRVTELRDEIGADDFDEVFDLFLDNLRGVVEKLRHRLNADDLESDLHYLKGSALDLGFSAFAAKCHTGERLAADGHRDRIDIAVILDHFDRSLTQFTQELPKKFAA